MIKKILAVLLCFCFAVPMFVMAEEEDYETMRFNSAEYTEAVEFLITLGVLSPDDEYLKTETWTVSRGEFVNLVIKAIGYSELISNLAVSGVYTDVPSEHPYSKVIEYAYQSGLLGEKKGAFFRPDDPLDLELAAKMAISITGQDIFVKNNDDYLKLAYKAKLFDDVKSYGNSKINRGYSLYFLKNLLCAEVVSIDSMTPSGSVSIDTNSNETVISSYLKLGKKTGVVTSDGITTVFGEKASPGRITIDGKSYVCLTNNYIGLAGQSVTYYVEYGDEVIRAIDTRKNDIVTVDADSIVSYSASTASYVANIDGKTKTIPISRDAYYVYNFMPGYSVELMTPESGAVTLIDHNGDEIYDVVLVQEFTNTVVNTYSSYTEIIYDEEDSTYDIDLSAFRDYTLVDIRGNSILPESIKQYSIVSLYVSADEKNAHLIVSDSHKGGKLKCIDNENRIITVEETDYQVSSEIRFAYNELKVSNEYEFYFDSYGEIAYIRVDAGLMTYLLTGDEFRESGRRVVELEVLDETTKKMTAYKLAPKVKVIRPGEQEEKMKAEDLYHDILLDGNDNFIRDMVLIKLNSNSEISQMIFPLEIATYEAYTVAPKYPLYNLSYLSNDLPSILLTGTQANPTLRFRSATGGFNRWIVLGSGSMMFYVPTSEDIDDPESVVAKFTDYSGDDTEYLNEITFYSKDIDDISVRYMLKKQAAQADFTNSTPGVVTDMRWVYDSKLDEYVVRINVITMGGEKVYFTNSEDAISVANVEGNDIRSDKEKIEVGDVVRFITNESGYITQFSLMWDAKAGIDVENNETEDAVARFGALAVPSQTRWDQGGWSIVPGIVEKRSGNVLEYTIDKTGSLTDVKDRVQRIQWGLSNKALIIDYSNKKPSVVTDASASEICKGDRLLILTYAGQSYVLTVYRR